MVGNDKTSDDQAGSEAASGDEAGRDGVGGGDAGRDKAASRAGPHIYLFAQDGTETLCTTMNGIDSIKGWQGDSKVDPSYIHDLFQANHVHF